MNIQNTHSSTRLPISNIGLVGSDDMSGVLSSGAPKDGGDINGMMALFMSNQSVRELSKKIVQYNAAAVLGALAYKAHLAWKGEMPLGNTSPITSHNITQSSPLPRFVGGQLSHDDSFLTPVLMKTMIAASKANSHADLDEQADLLKAAEQLGFHDSEMQAINGLMNREISVQEIARSVSLDKHKAQVYLAAYFSITNDSLSGRKFLEDLAEQMGLHRDLPNYLERQAKAGIQTA